MVLKNLYHILSSKWMVSFPRQYGQTCTICSIDDNVTICINTMLKLLLPCKYITIIHLIETEFKQSPYCSTCIQCYDTLFTWSLRSKYVKTERLMKQLAGLLQRIKYFSYSLQKLKNPKWNALNLSLFLSLKCLSIQVG